MNPTTPGRPIVICVDDDEQTLAALRRVLRGLPCEIVTTRDPQAALDRLETEGVRVLVTDQRMPRMKGTDLLRQARERSPDTRRVVLTAYPDTELVVLRVIRLVDRLVTKPWHADELRKLIADLAA